MMLPFLFTVYVLSNVLMDIMLITLLIADNVRDVMGVVPLALIQEFHLVLPVQTTHIFTAGLIAVWWSAQTGIMGVSPLIFSDIKFQTWLELRSIKKETPQVGVKKVQKMTQVQKACVTLISQKLNIIRQFARFGRFEVSTQSKWNLQYLWSASQKPIVSCPIISAMILCLVLLILEASVYIRHPLHHIHSYNFSNRFWEQHLYAVFIKLSQVYLRVCLYRMWCWLWDGEWCMQTYM